MQCTKRCTVLLYTHMAGSTEPMSVVELCIPGTLRICVHVENVLCLRDFYSQTLKSFSDRPHHGRHRHKRGILGCSSIVIFENNIDEAFVKVQSASVCFEIFHESLDLGKKTQNELIFSFSSGNADNKGGAGFFPSRTLAFG